MMHGESDTDRAFPTCLHSQRFELGLSAYSPFVCNPADHLLRGGSLWSRHFSLIIANLSNAVHSAPASVLAIQPKVEVRKQMQAARWLRVWPCKGGVAQGAELATGAGGSNSAGSWCAVGV